MCETCFRAGLHTGEADGMFRERLAALTDPDADGGGYPAATAAAVAKNWVQHDIADEAARDALRRYESSFQAMCEAGRTDTENPPDMTKYTLAATVKRLRMEEEKAIVLDLLMKAMAAADERGGPSYEEQVTERALRESPMWGYTHPVRYPEPRFG